MTSTGGCLRQTIFPPTLVAVVLGEQSSIAPCQFGCFFGHKFISFVQAFQSILAVNFQVTYGTE
jgi:hypothetical protein